VVGWNVSVSPRNPKRMQRMTSRGPWPPHLVIAGLAALIVAGDHAAARSARTEGSVESIQSRIAGEPIMAIVSLHDQRITLYDATGWILRAPVSSGQKGRETPAGIFSVIQKEAEHYSNLYDDAFMPHMQRITWSGIALHGGPLPGFAASHGCIRLPYDFAARLFDLTRLGIRVIVAPTDVAPIEIAHPALFMPKPGTDGLAAARTAEAEDAARKAAQARQAAVAASRESGRAVMAVRAAETLKLRAEAQLAAAETALGSAISPTQKERATDARAKAAARIEELQAQLAAANAELQPKLDAVAPAREAAVTAEAARVVAAEAAREAARALQPVSVFISRKTQRVYVRRAFQPILETSVTILEPERPIGTHVFTAMERTNGDTGMRWSVVSLDGGRPHGDGVEPHAGTSERPEVEPIAKEPSDAKTALDRIVIPQDVRRIAEMASARSSLIISDEELSSETGKGTDFVVLLSGEPQGGIAIRRRRPATEAWYERPRFRLPFWR
jgi:lipoprotein-anchoring transpeptidase ErfK/SrfK